MPTFIIVRYNALYCIAMVGTTDGTKQMEVFSNWDDNNGNDNVKV